MGENDENVQKASQDALNFCKNINKEDIESCLFKDELVNVSNDDKTLGELTINVEKVLHSGEVVLLVHAFSQGKIDDVSAGTSLTAYVRHDLSLIEQHHQEFVKVPDHELEKITTMKANYEENVLTVNTQITQGSETKSHSYSYPLNDVEGLITEGSNLILQRLLAKMEVQEFNDLVFLNIDPESGKLFPGTYKSLPERMQNVDKKEISVLGIERTVLSANELPGTWQSFFMDDGHLTMRVQVGSPHVVTVETVPQRIDRDDYEQKPIFVKKPLNWEEDAELKSIFLERKEALKADHFTYLREHPDAQALLADFMQFVLLRKPDDIIKFAGEFFSSFSASLPETSSYKHS